MSMYYGLKYGKDLCALFGLSAFLSEDSKVYEVNHCSELTHKLNKLYEVLLLVPSYSILQMLSFTGTNT